jgi:indole-3-glycerol phosphate synthase
VSAPATLDAIVARVRERVAELKRSAPLERILAESPTPGALRRFTASLRVERPCVIAEFKRRSPSRGTIREDLTPFAVAQQYETAGAAALSVLTEPEFFGGSLEDLRQARAATMLPTLRKDFVVDEYQIWEARLSGADAVLLIVAALDDAELRGLLGVAGEALLDALVEVHDGAELKRALEAGATLIGVNNRDLRTMEVRLETSLELIADIPGDVVKVSESGIRSSDDLRRLKAAGFDAFLVGEHLMSAPQPGVELSALLRGVGPR